MGQTFRLMELDIGRQGIALLLSVLTGALCGLGYDVLGPLRKLRTSGADALFGLLCFVAAFLLGQGYCGGKLGVFELMALGIGFWGYRRILHAPSRAPSPTSGQEKIGQ